MYQTYQTYRTFRMFRLLCCRLNIIGFQIIRFLTGFGFVSDQNISDSYQFRLLLLNLLSLSLAHTLSPSLSLSRNQLSTHTHAQFSVAAKTSVKLSGVWFRSLKLSPVSFFLLVIVVNDDVVVVVVIIIVVIWAAASETKLVATARNGSAPIKLASIAGVAEHLQQPLLLFGPKIAFVNYQVFDCSSFLYRETICREMSLSVITIFGQFFYRASRHSDESS